MQTRSNARHLVRLRVNLVGDDGRGNTFKQTVFTHDISLRGARLSDAPPLLNPAAVVKLQYGRKQARYRVVWVGGPVQDEVGLVSLDPPAACIWGTPLPGTPIPVRK